jgi:transposase
MSGSAHRRNPAARHNHAAAECYDFAKPAFPKKSMGTSVCPLDFTYHGCPEVARLLGDAPRSVEYWVHHFDKQGLSGLTEGDRSGRPSRLEEKHIREINRVLREKPSDAGMRVNLWDGKTLSAWIEKTYDIQLGVRQCQRLFRQLEFRLRKPRPVLARADPARQKKHKKNSES